MTGYDPVQALLDELVAGRVVAVVGAGFTIATTSRDQPASWPALIRHGAQYARAHHRLTAGELDEIEAALAQTDAATLVTAAERVERALKAGSGTWVRWLKESVAKFEVTDGALLHALRHLKVPLATTNYDTLLSDGHVPAISWRSFGEAETFMRGEDGVLHLHGVHKDPESIVFGSGSYDAVLASELAQFTQRALGKIATLLFVGCGPGLRDPNVGALFDWLDRNELSHSHYRLVLGGEDAAPVADCVTDVEFGSDYGDLPIFIRALAEDRNDRLLNRPHRSRVEALRTGRSAGPPPTYLLCDADPAEIKDLPVFLPARPWAGAPEGTALPLGVLQRLARTLEDDGDLPAIILIDDFCPFAPDQPAEHNATRTMSALSRLFDTYGLDRDRRPVCIQFSHVPSKLAGQLTFMELGGDAVITRQPGDVSEADRVRHVLARIRDGELAWQPPRPPLAAPDDGEFWADLFPLLPLLHDAGFITGNDICDVLDIDESQLNARVRALRARLEPAVADLPADARRRVARRKGDAALPVAAEQLGYAWIVQEKLRDADDVDWDRVLPRSRRDRTVSPLRLRSSFDESVRAAWYPQPNDPRRRVGAAWPPSPYLRGA